MKLDAEALMRYARQLAIDEVGAEGQQRLAHCRVLLIGAGGLGSPVAYYLVAAGIGCLGLVDSDVVNPSNLNRQILHTTPDLGKPKVVSALNKLQRLNPGVEINIWAEKVSASNAADLAANYDLIVDATDNLPARLLINDIAMKLGKPFFHGAVTSFYGQVMTILPNEGPCLRCIMDNLSMEPPAGGTPVLGPIAGVVGSIQATQVLKYCLGQGELLVGKMLVFDGLNMTLETVEMTRNPACKNSPCPAGADS